MSEYKLNIQIKWAIDVDNTYKSKVDLLCAGALLQISEEVSKGEVEGSLKTLFDGIHGSWSVASDKDELLPIESIESVMDVYKCTQGQAKLILSEASKDSSVIDAFEMAISKAYMKLKMKSLVD